MACLIAQYENDTMAWNRFLTLVGSNKSSQSAVAAPATDPGDQKGAPESKALRHLYKGELGEAWAGARMPRGLEGLVSGYLANDVDTDEYTPEQLAAFKLFDKTIAPIAATTREINSLILSGYGTKAFALLEKADRACLESVCAQRDPFGRLIEGTPWFAARTTCNLVLADKIATLMTRPQRDAQIDTYFPAGWEIETKKRMDQYRNAAKNYVEALIKKREMKLRAKTFQDLLLECKDENYNYRLSLRPKPNDPAIKMGLTVDPQTYLNVRQLFLDNEARLGNYGSLECNLLWVIGFQSLLGASSAPTAHILAGGANNYGRVTPPEVLLLKDGTPFYCDDLSRGVGATCVVSYFGDAYDSDGAARDGWRWLIAAPRGGGWLFLENLCRATTPTLQSLCSLQTNRYT